jgi:hypothetical protein
MKTNAPDSIGRLRVRQSRFVVAGGGTRVSFLAARFDRPIIFSDENHALPDFHPEYISANALMRGIFIETRVC